MTPEQIEQERAEFEAWAKSAFIHINLTLVTKKDGTSEYAGKAARHMFEGWLARAEQTGWISVEEDLPDYGITVLTATEEGFVSTDYLVEERGAEFDCIWRFAVTSSPITHWQPLPQPPKGD